jgi:hypothetical protein
MAECGTPMVLVYREGPVRLGSIQQPKENQQNENY